MADGATELKRIFGFLLQVRKDVIERFKLLDVRQVAIIVGEIMQEIPQNDSRYEDIVDAIAMYGNIDGGADEKDTPSVVIPDENAKKFLRQLLYIYFGFDASVELLDMEHL